MLWINASRKKVQSTLNHQTSLSFGLMTLWMWLMVTGETQTASVHCNDNHLKHLNLIALTGVGREEQTKRHCTEQQTKKLFWEESQTEGVWRNVWVGKHSDPISGLCFDIYLTVVYGREIMMQQPSWSETVSDLLIYLGENHVLSRMLLQKLHYRHYQNQVM